MHIEEFRRKYDEFKDLTYEQIMKIMELIEKNQKFTF